MKNTPYEASIGGERYYSAEYPSALADFVLKVPDFFVLRFGTSEYVQYKHSLPERLVAFYESGRGSTEDWAAIRSAYRLGGLTAALALVP